jgi:hypothetical protein
MSIRRATTAFMTSVAAFITAQAANPTNAAALGITLEAINPPSQAGSSSASLITTPATVAAAINAGALTIANNAASPMWLTIPSAALRAILGGQIASLPSEPLQLSQECACNFLAGWDAVFAAAPLSFTTFAATAAVPTLNC